MAIIRYRSIDSPDARGRNPESGELRWTLSIPLENGDDYLEVAVGKRGRDAIKRMLQQEEDEGVLE